MRGRLERLLGANASLAVVGVVSDPAALAGLIDKTRVDLALVDCPTAEQVLRWTRRYRQTALVALIDDAHGGALDALRAGARAVLARSANEADIAIAVAAAGRGL